MAPPREGRTYMIGDLADLFGISRRTLRFYEERELLRPRRNGTQRVYTNDDRLRLEIIVRAKRLGFSLATIWELMQRRNATADGLPASCEELVLSEDEIAAQVERLTRERERVHRAIEELRAAACRHGWTNGEASPAEAADAWSSETPRAARPATPSPPISDETA